MNGRLICFAQVWGDIFMQLHQDDAVHQSN